MNTWFDLEHSSKGAKHGLGLYYVKQICQKYRANIICRNVECQGKNWIEMNLELRKRIGNSDLFAFCFTEKSHQ